MKITQAVHLNWKKNPWFVQTKLENLVKDTNEKIFKEKFIPFIKETIKRYNNLKKK